jgi:long-chain fatty acid transport protein
MKSLRRCVASAGAFAVAMAGGAQQEAKAAGFANTNAGGEQGTVVATNPMALYYNPAGMAFAKGSQLGLYGGLALRSASYERPGNPATDIPDPPGAQGANTGKASLFNAFGGPAIGGTLKIGNLVLGAGFFAPFYGRAHWGQNDAFVNSTKFPLAAAGVQRWFSIDAATSVLYFTAGAAYRFGPLSIGATGNFVSTTVNSTTAKNPGGTNTPDTSSEGRAFLDAHEYNGSFGAGLMLEAVPDQLWIAASYQAQPGLGPQALKGQFNVTSPTAGMSSNFNINFLQALPDIWRAGVRWRLKNAPLEFRVFGDRTDWSKFNSQCIVLLNKPCDIAADGSDNTAGGPVQAYLRRDWNNTYGVRLGVSWWAVPAVELLFGAGYETAASPDSTLAPDAPDATTIQGTLGARLMLTESLFLTASYTQIQSLTRNNEGKSTLAADAQGNPVIFPSTEEDAGGIYKSWIGLLTGNLEALF